MGEYGQEQMVRYLLKEELAIFDMALCGAAKGNYKNIAEILIEYGASNFTAAHNNAETNHNDDLAKWLLANLIDHKLLSGSLNISKLRNSLHYFIQLLCIARASSFTLSELPVLKLRFNFLVQMIL